MLSFQQFFKQKKGKKEESQKDVFRNPKILDVNLVKDEVEISFDWPRNITTLAVVLFIAGFFIVEIYFGLDLWREKEIVRAQSLGNDIVAVTKEISKIKEKADEASAYRNKSVELNRLLGEHIYWSNFFNWLEKNTLNTVKYDGFSGNTKGVYAFSVKASSYAEASWQVKAFLNSPLVKKAEVSSVASFIDKKTGQGGVNFSLTLEVSPDIFKK